MSRFNVRGYDVDYDNDDDGEDEDETECLVKHLFVRQPRSKEEEDEDEASQKAKKKKRPRRPRGSVSARVGIVARGNFANKGRQPAGLGTAPEMISLGGGGGGSGGGGGGGRKRGNNTAAALNASAHVSRSTPWNIKAGSSSLMFRVGDKVEVNQLRTQRAHAKARCVSACVRRVCVRQM